MTKQGGFPLHGSVEPGFESVDSSFGRGLAKAELGAAVCVYVDGRKVVDLWGGWADAARTCPWQRDTIAYTMSATKGMTATCAHRLVDCGVLDADEAVATYWPEFGQAGKDKVTVRMVLSHQAGLPYPTKRVDPDKRLDWDTMTDALARSAPVWEPGTRSEYHGGTFGYLVGEIVRRVDGRSLDAYFREEIAEPFGADFLMRVSPATTIAAPRSSDRRTWSEDPTPGRPDAPAMAPLPAMARLKVWHASTPPWPGAGNWTAYGSLGLTPSQRPYRSSRCRLPEALRGCSVSATSSCGSSTQSWARGHSGTRAWAGSSASPTGQRESALGSS